MTKKQALKLLEKMTDTEFGIFFDKLPERVRILVRAGFVNWKEILPEWYIKSK